MKKSLLGLVIILGVGFASVAKAEMGIPSKKQKNPGFIIAGKASVNKMNPNKQLAGKQAVNRMTSKRFAGRALVNKISKKFAGKVAVNSPMPRV